MLTAIKILVADDEPDILDFLSYNLEKEGYKVYTASNGLKALEKANEKEPHLILLDIMMPEKDGIEVCRELRQHEKFSETIIAFLTARDEEFTQIAGLEVGADDFITKPIKPRLLISKINSLLRRSQEVNVEDEILEIANLKIDKGAYLVSQNDREIYLPKKEFELLLLMAKKPGKVFTREKIMRRVWGNEIIVGPRTIDVHIRKLREKLGEDLIKTIKGVGYKIEVT